MSTYISIKKDAQLIRIYIGESDRWRNRPLYAAILDALKKNGLAGATVIRGVAGFGAHSRIHTAAILRLSQDLPLVIEVVDSPEKIKQALDVVTPMVREGLITLDEVQVIRYTHRYLNPLPVDKPVTDVMTTQIITLASDMQVAQAWEMMLEHLIKAMPVVDAGGRVLGMLTDEDLIHRAGTKEHLSVASRLDAETLKEQLDILRSSPLCVRDVMTSPAIVLSSQEALGRAAAIMARHEIKRLPVVDQNQKIVGIISRVDVLKQLLSVETRPVISKIPSGSAQTIDEIMISEIPLVREAAGLTEIVNALIESGMRKVIVVDADQRPVGLISDSDVVSRIQPTRRRGVLDALAGGPMPPDDISAVQLMSPGVLSALPGLPLVDAAQQMFENERKWLVVVDTQGKTLGIVDRQVLLRAIV
jgi:CBS domain-containing protein